MSKINLHVHSNFSDGRLSPEQIVKKAKKEKVIFLSLTDHDSIGGVERFLTACRGKNIACLPGVEISTEYKNKEFHILGYNVDVKNKPFCEILEKQRRVRRKRARKMMDKFEKLGFEINKKTAKKILKNESVGKPHIRDLILSSKENIKKLKIEYDFNSKTDDFIGLFINKPRQAGYVRKKKIPTKQAILAIKNAGGISVLAHPGAEFENEKEFEETAKNFISWGLGGIEIFYPYSEELNGKKIKFYSEFSKKHGLIATAGSDFHSEGNLRDVKIPKKEENLIIKNLTPSR
ncbi:MAG: PHP domain-containing protein [Patescibacteria group bacterium]